jgi:hypothetical protein
LGATTQTSRSVLFDENPTAAILRLQPGAAPFVFKGAVSDLGSDDASQLICTNLMKGQPQRF